jgi:hypothetical protein
VSTNSSCQKPPRPRSSVVRRLFVDDDDSAEKPVNEIVTQTISIANAEAPSRSIRSRRVKAPPSEIKTDEDDITDHHSSTQASTANETPFCSPMASPPAADVTTVGTASKPAHPLSTLKKFSSSDIISCESSLPGLFDLVKKSLPSSLLSLYEQFKVVDEVIALMRSRKMLPLFRMVKMNVERASGHQLSMSKLQQIMFIVPDLFSVAWVNAHPKGSSGDANTRVIGSCNGPSSSELVVRQIDFETNDEIHTRLSASKLEERQKVR